MKYKLRSKINDVWYFYVRPLTARLLYFFAVFFQFFNFKRTSINLCLMACRYNNHPGSNRLLKQLLEQTEFKYLNPSAGVTRKEAAGRSIILRWPEINEARISSKGVLLITFTRVFSYYINNIDLQKLHKYFYIVLEPSWSGYADPDILGFFDKKSKPIIQSSELNDRTFLNHFIDYCIPVSFGASDWVNPNVFIKDDQQKIYDSVYIANTNPIKRVYRYLKAIKNIVETRDPDYKACLVCAAWGGAEPLIRGLAESFKLERNLTFLFAQSRPQVIKILNQSKVNILLSLKEGSNRSLFEALFCGVPIILASSNIGVNKSYVNENTGLLLDDNTLEDGLLWMKDNYHRYDTRAWALANIAPDVTTHKLTQIINHNFGECFSDSDLFVKTNSPEVCYLEAEDFDHSQYSQKILELLQKNCSYSSKDLDEKIVELKNLFHGAINKTI